MNSVPGHQLASPSTANGESIFKDLLALSIADTYKPWEWQDYLPWDRQ